VCKCVLYCCHRVFVCKCVLYCCHRVTIQLQLINISYHITLSEQVPRSQSPAHIAPDYTLHNSNNLPFPYFALLETTTQFHTFHSTSLPACHFYFGTQIFRGYLLLQAIPLEARKGPEGSRRLRLPEFLANRYMEGVSLSVLGTDRFYFLGDLTVLISVTG
jgi:hypothetical protein